MDQQRVLDQILNRLSIVDLIQKYVPLKVSGRQHMGLCPFHSEKSPSFSVSAEKGLYHCFGCGAGGNLFTFYMQMERVTFPEAVKELARRAGVEVPSSPQDARRDSRRDAMRRALGEALIFFRAKLSDSSDGSTALSYLRDRGLTAETIDRFEIGWSPAEWESLAQHLRQKKIDLAVAEGCGLVRKKSSGYYDYFRARVIFPIRDAQGRLAGFGGRVLPVTGDGKRVTGDASHEPKYLNSPDSEVFRKGEILFGLHAGRDAILKKAEVTLVEGYMDAVSLHQAGFVTTVAPLGTALTTTHIRLLKRFSPAFRILFDPDEAGVKAALRSLPLLLAEGVLARAVLLPAGLDPDAFVRERGADALRALFASDRDLFEMAMDVILKASPPTTPQGKKAAADRLLAILRSVTDPIILDTYVRMLSPRLGVREDALWRSLPAMSRDTTAAPISGASARTSPPAGRLASLREKQRDLMERSALQAALDEPRLWSSLFHAAPLLKDAWHGKLLDTVRRRFEGGTPTSAEISMHFVDKDDGEKLSRLALERPPGESGPAELRLRNALTQLFELAKKEKLDYVRDLIHKAGKHNDDAEMRRLLLAKKRVENSQLEWPLDQTPDLFAEKGQEPTSGVSGRA